jgi:hypothetical protein
LLISAVILFFSLGDATEFAEKMSPYYGQDVSFTMHHFENGWWGGTVYDLNKGTCTNEVLLSDQLFGDLGDDDLWKGILAHEWAHVLQGKNCRDNEHQADVWALSMLAQAHEMDAFDRYLRFLREVRGWR